MSGQEKQRPQRRENAPEEFSESLPAGASVKEGLDDDIDSVLDEIDDVLESNAEDFVKSFVQKGGQ